jgi:uncharacterized protein
MARIRFQFATLTLEAELLDTPTARAVAAALPISTSVLTWGEEVYFEIPVKLPAEKDARAVVTPGEIAYWPQGTASRWVTGAPPSAVATRSGLQAPATYLPGRQAM